MSAPCVCTTVRKANRALFRFYENALSQTELSVVQFAVLRLLERQGDMPLARIAEDQAMERTSLYRTLTPLLDSGAIRLTKADRGNVKIAGLTTKGRRQIARTLPHWDAAQREMLSKMGGERWAQIAETLLAVPALLTADE